MDRCQPASQNIAANLDETHRLFQSSMSEFLEYWTDQNTEHISSANDVLKRCVTLMNATIDATKKRMEKLGAGAATK